MNFLAPLFLLGALAIAGPVIFHLIRRTTRDRQRFGSLMFLEPSPPRLTKRSRIENWLLLLLRCAALALLALAFARPFFRTTSPSDGQSAAKIRLLVLVDTSASMRRQDLWDRAKERTMKVLEQASMEDDAAIASFDRAVTTLVTFDDWHRSAVDARTALARERLDSTAPSWSGTNAAAALMAAAEMLSENAEGLSGRGEIVLVTDAQEGSRLDALQGYEWPKNVRVRIEAVAAARTGNAGLQLAADSGTEATESLPAVRLRVNNSADSPGEAFQIGWQAEGGGFSGAAQDVYVPPGQSRIVTLAWPDGAAKSGRVMLRGDAEEFDNVVTVVPPPNLTIPVIHSGTGAEPRSPLFFLQKALPASRALTASVAHFGPDALPPAELTRSAALWVVTDSIDAPAAAAAGTYASSGGTVLVMLQSPGMSATLQTIAGTSTLTVEAVKPSSFAMLGTIDFSHPLFAAFAEPRFSDFTKIRFWRYCKLDAAAIPGAKVAAMFDSGDPAVLEVPRQSGRIFVLAAGWHPDSSQLALSSKFPSLLGSLLMITGAGTQIPSQFFAGEPVPVSSLAPNLSSAAGSARDVRITSPDGKISTSAATEIFTGFSSPALYHVTSEGNQRDIAVNLDPAESRTLPLTVEEFEKLGTPVASSSKHDTASSPASEALAAATEAESRQKIWRWLLAVVFAVLFAETLLGSRSARHYSAAEGGSAT